MVVLAGGIWSLRTLAGREGTAGLGVWKVSNEQTTDGGLSTASLGELEGKMAGCPRSVAITAKNNRMVVGAVP